MKHQNSRLSPSMDQWKLSQMCSTTDNGRVGRSMAEESSSGPMAPSMKGIGKRTRPVVLGVWCIPMATSMRANGRTIRLTATECIGIRMGRFIRGSGSRTNSMGMG